MGRGRQRAKQRKVARDLKYFSPETDYAALERELIGKSNSSADSDSGNPDSEWSSYDSYNIPPAEDDWDEDDWMPPHK
ncbi:DUF3073 domain-containing protein [Arcanobacterium phocisimile]|uniref:DUF3073 domain-containing protein n=1 Tax=Arcanobacterium phocisimile TaxID=1302235 RepID=A0ABX7IGY2_9ACTO|nr:DUF3073 domain-containing protein [Arcanobacterium phocisimile]QRV02383.1 DUF3073 domain-containing protein [Arcanobacterium phocisimile]